MTVDREQRRAQIQTFVHFSPWRNEVPDVPERDVCEWGTIAWARYALALLAELEQAERDRDDARVLLDGRTDEVVRANQRRKRAEARLAKVPALVDAARELAGVTDPSATGYNENQPYIDRVLEALAIWEAE